MSVHPELFTHGSFRHLKLGRSAPRHDDRTLKLAKYLDTATLPPVPASVDYTSDVPSWPMDSNDTLGCCTIAAAAHLVQAWTASAGKEVVPTDQDVLNMYWATGNPPNQPCSSGGPTDNGRVELDVLKYWKAHGLGADRIGAYVQVDSSNLDEVRAALYLFGGIYGGVALPRSAQGQAVWDVVGDGKTGESAPGSWGGHAVPLTGFDATSFTCITWGAPLKLTVAFFSAYFAPGVGGETWAILTPDWFAQDGKAVNGFDAQALQTDLAAVAAS